MPSVLFNALQNPVTNIYDVNTENAHTCLILQRSSNALPQRNVTDVTLFCQQEKQNIQWNLSHNTTFFTLLLIPLHFASLTK